MHFSLCEKHDFCASSPADPERVRLANADSLGTRRGTTGRSALPQLRPVKIPQF